MSSKQVTDRQKSATAVVAAAETNADSVGQALTAILQPHLQPGESMPDVALFMRLVARALDASKTAMVKADEAHDAELADDLPIRKARDDAQAALTDKVVELREVIVGLYGTPAANTIFKGAAPQDPVVLSRFASDVATALGDVPLPAPRIAGAKIDAVATAAEIVALRATLDGHLKDVAREIREAQSTADIRNQRMAAYDDAFAAWATSLAGLLRAAGKPELAARLRPSVRRPGQTASDVGEEPATPQDPTK